MPELPEVDAVCRRLQEQSAGRTVLNARILRPQTTKPYSQQSVVRRVAGRRIEAVTRRAKNVLIQMDEGLTLRIHLGMTGNLWVDNPANRPARVRGNRL
jgi:formamidopyrimidine-DNA glycosylase